MPMEARDTKSKIRPLPIDEIYRDGLPQHRVDPLQRWLLLIVIIMGAMAFAIVARGLGPTRGTEVGAASTTTPAMAWCPTRHHVDAGNQIFISEGVRGSG